MKFYRLIQQYVNTSIYLCSLTGKSKNYTYFTNINYFLTKWTLNCDWFGHFQEFTSSLFVHSSNSEVHIRAGRKPFQCRHSVVISCLLLMSPARVSFVTFLNNVTSDW